LKKGKLTEGGTIERKSYEGKKKKGVCKIILEEKVCGTTKSEGEKKKKKETSKKKAHSQTKNKA